MSIFTASLELTNTSLEQSERVIKHGLHAAGNTTEMLDVITNVGLLNVKVWEAEARKDLAKSKARK